MVISGPKSLKISSSIPYNRVNGAEEAANGREKMVRRVVNKARSYDGLPNGRWTLDEGFYEFERRNKVKGLREATMKDYQHFYDRFKKFMDNSYPDLEYCGDLRLNHVQDYILDLKSTDMRGTSVNTYLRHIRTYLNYLFDLEAAPRFKVPIVKVDKQIKPTYSEDELGKLLMRPNMKTSSFSAYRNWVIVNFLLDTAVRAQTLLETKVGDVDLENFRLELRHNKNRKAYIIPLSERLVEILLEYLEIRSGDLADPLFCNDEGEVMSYEGLKSAIKRYNLERGVTKGSLHLFRHTFAKTAVMNGMDPFRLQKYLGHSDLTVSRQYVEMFAEDLAVGFSGYSPLNNFNYSKGKATKTKKIRMK